jgi:hypothetical protein
MAETTATAKPIPVGSKNSRGHFGIQGVRSFEKHMILESNGKGVRAEMS